MKILISYNDEIILATVLESYKVEIPDVNNHGFTIDIDQCRTCGVWKSEDEELYGDGYCTNCCVMCDTCEQYKPHAEMMKFKQIDCNQCIPCNKKV